MPGNRKELLQKYSKAAEWLQEHGRDMSPENFAKAREMLSGKMQNVIGNWGDLAEEKKAQVIDTLMKGKGMTEKLSTLPDTLVKGSAPEQELKQVVKGVTDNLGSTKQVTNQGEALERLAKRFGTDVKNIAGEAPDLLQSAKRGALRAMSRIPVDMAVTAAQGGDKKEMMRAAASDIAGAGLGVLGRGAMPAAMMLQSDDLGPKKDSIGGMIESGDPELQRQAQERIAKGEKFNAGGLAGLTTILAAIAASNPEYFAEPEVEKTDQEEELEYIRQNEAALKQAMMDDMASKYEDYQKTGNFKPLEKGARIEALKKLKQGTK